MQRERLHVSARGDWTLETVAGLARQLERWKAPGRGKWQVDLSELRELDTAGAVVLQGYIDALSTEGAAQMSGLSESDASLLELVRRGDGQQAPVRRTPGALETIGRETVYHLRRALGLLDFVGEFTLDMAPRFLRPHRIRWRQAAAELQRAGVDALPIAGLLSFLMGVVIAYQGGTALQTFGANIYLVNLLAITMLREMAPLLTAIIVAGRTGSSYAAQIGTMRITEEVDALRTLGITPLEMLALPKLIALVIALPLLTVWADALGLLGGMLVSNTFYGISAANFLNRLPEAVWPSTFWVGLVKTPVFAVLITIIGCYQGLKVRGSAEEVGQATTASVVQAIFLVIIADAFFSIAFQQVGL
ncbi:MAG: MlaE family lipid ABC transporter permease subunit [Ectothiorhodospiraceae bacterium]